MSIQLTSSGMFCLRPKNRVMISFSITLIFTVTLTLSREREEEEENGGKVGEIEREGDGERAGGWVQITEREG